MTDETQNIPTAPTSAAGGKPPVTEEQVREALRSVVDPELGLDVVALGLIRELDLQPDHSHVVMLMTTPFCPYAPQLLELTRRAVQEATGVPTTIELGLDQWTPDLMEEGAGQDWGLFY
ncbi:MAG TPA: metal-sulfur cluster assembly factor [Aggregatilineales bacterium]|nr:metal-sulfur cluster assembly factor [Aggregatilineales bacterium]